MTALAWVGAVLFAGTRPNPRRHPDHFLDLCARVVGNLIVIRSAELTGRMRRSVQPSARFGADLSRSGRRRAAIGARLRRALYHPDRARRLANLAEALRDLDLWAAAFARRLSAGLTRRRPILAAPERIVVACALGAPTCAAHADTS